MKKQTLTIALLSSSILLFSSEEQPKTPPTRKERLAAIAKLRLDKDVAEMEALKRAEGNSPTQREAERTAHSLLGNRTNRKK